MPQQLIDPFNARFQIAAELILLRHHIDVRPEAAHNLQIGFCNFGIDDTGQLQAVNLRHHRKADAQIARCAFD
ncbi:hypothetical protein D3C87_2104820 [compost metagenome]